MTLQDSTTGEQPDKDTAAQTTEQQTDTAAGPSPDEQTKTDDPSTGGDKAQANTQPEDNVPFHKHPRWQQLNQRNKDLETAVNELMQFKTQAEARLSQSGQQTGANPQIPDWFKSLYGDVPEVWQQYQTYDKQLRDEIKKEVFDDLRKQHDEEVQSTKKWNSWVEGQFDALEDSGKAFDRNELRKFILDWNEQYRSLPLDDEGNIDIAKCYELMVKMRPAPDSAQQKLSERKKLAGKLDSTTTTDPKPNKALSLDDLRGKRDWRDF